MASGFTPPSDDRSRTTRGSDDSAPARGSTDLVPAVSVIRARTQSRPRAQAKAQAGSDSTSTPSPQQQGVSLSAQQATLLAGASIQRAHQASEMASAAASSALQGHQAAVWHRLGRGLWSQRPTKSWIRFGLRDTEAQARQEARELHFQLSGTHNALSESHEQTRMLQAQVQQLQDEKSQLASRLERIETRTPVPSVATPRQPQTSSSAHYPHMMFSPDQASPKATVQFQGEQSSPIQHSHASLPAVQPVERTAQPVRLQALFEGAASGAPVLGREGSPTAQPESLLPQDDDDMARDFDLFGPGPEPVASAGIVQDRSAQSPSVEERMNQLTSVVQELAKLVTTGVATQSAQPLEGAAQGAPAASSSDALVSHKPGGPQIPLLKLRATSAAHAGSGPPPDSPSSSSSGSSSSDDEEKPACRMCGSAKHHEKDCPKLTANKRGKKGDPPGSSPGGGGGSSSPGSNGGSHRDVADGSASAEKTLLETEEETLRL